MSPSSLDRFVDVQQSVYATALAEIRSGRKTTHWMWFIFPQIKGLGNSAMAARYAISDIDEARAYLRHPTLGPRLIECADAVLSVKGKSAREIFGPPDDLKLRSSATLFAQVSPPGSVFQRILDQYYSSEPDPLTWQLLAKSSE